MSLNLHQLWSLTKIFYCVSFNSNCLTNERNLMICYIYRLRIRLGFTGLPDTGSGGGSWSGWVGAWGWSGWLVVQDMSCWLVAQEWSGWLAAIGWSSLNVVGSAVFVRLPMIRWAGLDVIPSSGVFLKFNSPRCGSSFACRQVFIMFFATFTAASAAPLLWLCPGLDVTCLKPQLGVKSLNCCDEYWGPLSLMTVSGIPWRAKWCFSLVITVSAVVSGIVCSDEVVSSLNGENVRAHLSPRAVWYLMHAECFCW